MRSALVPIIEHLLAEAKTSAKRLDADDPESLHDFRVALRRLRTYLKVFKDLLGRAASKKQRRHLKTIAHATNAARDAEAAVQWSTRLKLNAPIETLQNESRVSKKFLRALEQDFRQVHRKVKRRLRKAGCEPKKRTFQDLLIERLRETAKRLQDEVDAIKSVRDESRIHRARIAIKNTRYLLESAGNRVPTSRRLLATLKSWQRLLGDLHDLHTLEPRLESAALGPVHAKEERLFKDVERRRGRLRYQLESASYET